MSANTQEDQLHRINLQTLQNRDPFITKILDQAQRVCVYKFLADKREWVTSFSSKCDRRIDEIEFSLGKKRYRRNFVCLRKVIERSGSVRCYFLLFRLFPDCANPCMDLRFWAPFHAKHLYRIWNHRWNLSILQIRKHFYSTKSMWEVHRILIPLILNSSLIRYFWTLVYLQRGLSSCDWNFEKVSCILHWDIESDLCYFSLISQAKEREQNTHPMLPASLISSLASNIQQQTPSQHRPLDIYSLLLDAQEKFEESVCWISSFRILFNPRSLFVRNVNKKPMAMMQRAQ